MTGFGTDRRGMHRRRFLVSAGRIGLLALLPPVWTREAAAETSRSWRAMGTLIEVRVPDLPPPEAVAAIGTVRARVESLEAAMTLYRKESPLVALNRAREGQWVMAPVDLLRAVLSVRETWRNTQGAYDPTVGPALRGYGLQELDPGSADPTVWAGWRCRPGPDSLEIDLPRSRLRRRDRRVELDLGGIGKGIAVDAALRELARAGSRCALVNLGGSIGVLGPPRDHPEGWPVGVAHPRRGGELWTEFRLARGHVATSGDYERCFETPRGRVHHLIDPRSGEPARGIASVTVWSPTGVEADGASTALFIELSRGWRPPTPRPWMGVAVQEGRLRGIGSPRFPG